MLEPEQAQTRGVPMPVEGLDLESLLAPLDGEGQAGTDVREDFSSNSNYFRLRDARAEARAAERAADANPGSDAGIPEGWRNVRTLSIKILSEQAKDLEAAAWLTESLVRTEGLAGLAAGAGLINGLAERYWDNLFPMPDEDGIETRLSPVTGLNGEGADGTLIQPLLKLKLFTGADGGPVALFQYEQSAELSTLTDERRIESRLKAGVVPFETMETAARAAAGSFPALRAQLREAAAAWSAMGTTLDRVAGAYSPPTARVAGIFERIESLIARYAPEGDNEAAEAVAEAVPASGTNDAAPAAGTPRRLATREDALKQLSEIADFFRRTEPQSPLAYTIDDAIRRGRLSWPELIAEIVRDDQTRYNILNSLGIKAE
jgi:type VI secretion system protein ImpA